MDEKTVISRLAEFVVDQNQSLDGLSDEIILDTLIGLIEEDKNQTIAVLLDIFAEYADKCPDFRNTTTDKLNLLLNTADNSSESLENRQIAISKLIILLPFLSNERIEHILTLSIDFCKFLLDTTKIVPTSFISAFDDLIIKNMNDEERDLVINIFVSNMQSEKSFESFLIFSPFSEDLLIYYPDHHQLFIDRMIEYFDGNEFHKTAACLFLKNFVPVLSEDFENQKMTDFYIEHLGDCLNSEDEIMQKSAYEAFLMLIKYDFINETKTNEIFSLLEKFSSKKSLKKYFQVLSFFCNPTYDEDIPAVEDECNYNFEVVNSIIEFCQEKIEQENGLIRGLCINLLSDIYDIDATFIEPILNDLLQVIEKIIDEKEFISFPFLASFLLSASKNNLNESSNTIDLSIPAFIAAIKSNEIQDNEEKCDLISDICSIISDGFGKNEYKTEIVEFCSEFIKSNDDYCILTASNCISMLRNFLTAEIANVLYELLAKKILETENEKVSLSILYAIKKLMTKFDVDISKIDLIIESMLDGSINSFNGKNDFESFYFVFIKNYFQKLSQKSSNVHKISLKLVDLLEKTKFSVVAHILPVIDAAIETGVVDKQNAAKIVEFVQKFIAKLLPTDAGEIVCVSETLICLMKSYDKILEPIEFYMEKLDELAHMICDSEKKIEFSEDIISKISKVIFFACAQHDFKWTDKNIESFIFFTKMMSFDCDDFPELIQSYIMICDKEDTPQQVIIHIIKLFTNLAVLEKREQDEIGLSLEQVMFMKKHVRKFVHQYPESQHQLIQDFKSSRSKITRFNAIIR